MGTASEMVSSTSNSPITRRLTSGPAAARAATLQGFPGRSTLHRPGRDRPTIVDSRDGQMSDLGEPREPSHAGPSDEVVVVPGKARSPFWAAPGTIFVGALVLAMLTFGSSVALLTRVGTLESLADEVTQTTAPARASTPAPTAPRVTAANATAERLDTGNYRVTFLWTLQSAKEGDTVLLRFSVGSRVISEQRGVLDATVFSSSTGRFAVATTQECSADGWSAEIVSIRGLTPVGAPTSRVSGVTCR